MAYNDAYDQALKSVVNEIKQIPIEDIYTNLTGNTVRRNGKVLCWVHDDTDPSMGFYEKNGRFYFHCFACNEAGDSIKMAQQILNIGFVEAVSYLCSQFGLTMPVKSQYDNVQIQDPFPFFPSELSLVGLRSGNGYIKAACNFGFPEKTPYTSQKKEDLGYVLGLSVPVSMQRLWSGKSPFADAAEGKELCLDMVCQKLACQTLSALDAYQGRIWQCFPDIAQQQCMQEALESMIEGLYRLKNKIMFSHKEAYDRNGLAAIPQMPGFYTVPNRAELVLL